MKFKIYQDAKGEYRWKLVSGNGQTVAVPGEGFSSKQSCEKNIELVKSAADAPVEEVSE